MDFLNPLSLILSLSLAGPNLYELDESAAERLTGTYVQEALKEGVQADNCPQYFEIEIVTGDNSGTFFLKRASHFHGLDARPQLIPVDGETHRLFGGEIINASVQKTNSIQIEKDNDLVPEEKIIETLVFRKDSLTYKAAYENDGRPRRLELCEQATYQRVPKQN